MNVARFHIPNLNFSALMLPLSVRLGQIHSAAFMVLLATGALLLSSSIDGALLAAKDFRPCPKRFAVRV